MTKRPLKLFSSVLPLTWAASVFAQGVPPTELYHYGPRAPLMRDVNARTVPPADWRDVIMGGGDEFAAPAYRRGLYGCPDLAAGDAYATAPDSWVIRVRLKPACRQPGAFTSIDWTKPDAKFRQWIAKAPGLPFRMADYAKRCVDEGELNITSEFGGDNPCNRIAQRYLADSRFKVIYDHNSPGCWYLRDRACIERIDGTPEEVLSFFPNWKPGVNAPNTLRVAVSALASLGGYDSPTVKALSQRGDSLGQIASALTACGKRTELVRRAQSVLWDYARELSEALPDAQAFAVKIQSACEGKIPAPREDSGAENHAKAPSH